MTDWSAADVETIVRSAVAPHGDGGNRFALAVHEPATHATKYGARPKETGIVNICWNVSSDERFLFY